MSVHIKRYLWGRAEFETNINRITVDMCILSFLHHHLSTTILALVLALAAASLACQSGDEPLPSIEGCGLDQNRLGSSEAKTRCSRPSPFHRDVGGFDSLDGGTGEGG